MGFFPPPPLSSIPREEIEEGLKTENVRGEPKEAFYMINARRLSIGFGGGKNQSQYRANVCEKTCFMAFISRRAKKFENSPMK